MGPSGGRLLSIDLTRLSASVVLAYAATFSVPGTDLSFIRYDAQSVPRMSWQRTSKFKLLDRETAEDVVA